MIWLVHHVISDLYPRTEQLPGAADTGLLDFLRRFRREAPRTLWFGVALSSILYIVAPLFTLGLPLPSFALSRTLRELHAQRITTTRFYLLRMAMMTVKMAAGLCWGMDPTVRQKMGLEPWPADPGTWRTQ